MGDYKLSCMPSMHSYYDVTAASKEDIKLLEEDLPVSSGYQDSATNLWSNVDGDSTAATLLHNLQQQNGGGVNSNYSFPPSLHNSQQFPPSSNTTSLQRRAITAAHNFPNNRQTSAGGPNMFQQANKSYPSTWSQQQQQNPAWSWSRGRSVPGSNPIPASLANRKPTQNLVSSQQMISPKFRRSTSYPGKQHMFHELEDSRDLLLPYQDRMKTANGPSPLDNMRNLEHYLNEISTGDSTEQQLKGFINCNSSALHSLAQIHGRSPYISAGLDDSSLLDDASPHLLDSHLLSHHAAPSLSSPSPSSPHSQGSDNGERFSRKVFVGGLPPDIDEEEITASFRRFGPLVVDWPHKAESKSYFPPKGYAFLLFQDESSVQQLIDACIVDEDKCYLCVSSPTIKDKPVQIRPWKLTDADFVLDASMPLDPRKTVFVGGVPRPLKALELAMIMDRLYGGVCYAGIDTDPELKYPKGAGRVAFASQASYIAAISARFVQLQHGEIDKRVEVKPYVLDDQMCDECQGVRCGGKFAPFFCANVCCLQYYCEHCWATIHSKPGREFHKPLVKEGADRPRTVPFRW